MIDNGETATTNASGISVVSRELQLPVTGCIFALLAGERRTASVSVVASTLVPNA
jgi:hypothetical protein